MYITVRQRRTPSSCERKALQLSSLMFSEGAEAACSRGFFFSFSFPFPLRRSPGRFLLCSARLQLCLPPRNKNLHAA